MKNFDGKLKRNLNRLAGMIFSLMFCFAFVGNFGVDALNANAETFSAEVHSAEVADLQNEGVIRPEDLNEGLSRKSFQDMEGRRVTLRQPYMEVTSRSVEREAAQSLGDVFQFVDPKTGLTYVGPAKELAKIDFQKDGKEGNTIGDATNPRYPMRGLQNDRDGKGHFFSNFEKYMLLRQAWYYRVEINKHLQTGDLKNFLKKHPAADDIYGKIDDSKKAASKVIVSDPIYKSPLTTGLYLVPGEVATVVVSGLKDGESVRLTTHQQDSLGYDGGFPDGFDAKTYFDAEQYAKFQKLNSTEKYFMYWDSQLIAEAERAYAKSEKPNYTQFDFKLQNQWQFQNQKVPCMGSIFELTQNGRYEIGSIYGGPLYLQPTNSAVKIEISGAVETPHFILGVTTAEEFDKYLRDAPGLIATLDVENGQLIGLSQYMKNCDNIEKLAYFWHSVFAINSSLNGREYNYNITMAYDVHVPAGEAVALNSSFAAQPYGWFEACMNYETLTTKGNWGTFHELGHIQAKTYGVNWGMCGSNCKNPCEGEVWNNTLIVLMYSMLCNMDTRVIDVEHGEYVHPFTSVKASMNLPEVNDYHDYNNSKNPHFSQLTLYSTLIHSFGPEKFIDFFYTYKVNRSYCDNARADFVYRIALVDHVNILDWINENYHGNISTADFSPEQLEFLRSLPTFNPIAYEWANGIDGNETARKYDVDGKHQTIFDLSAKSFASFKPFSILEVTDAEFGKVKYDAEKEKATYTPPSEVTENDEFEIVVSTEGGRIVTLNVRLHLVYNGAYIEVFKLDPNDTTPIKNLVETQKDKEPFRTEESAIAGKPRFTNDEKEYFHIRFSFKATQAGLHKFAIRGDDGITAFFKKNGEYIENGSGGVLYSNGFSAYAENKDENNNHFARATLQVGEIVEIDCHLVNRGGVGYMNVGVVFPDAEKVVDIPAENIINSLVSESDMEKVEKFQGWQPKFLDSIKDTTIDYLEERDDWEILKNPDNQSDDGQGKEAMLDGKNETFFHSKYSPNKAPLPHEFVIDCKKNVAVNYFDIVRRGNQNDALYEVSLYGAKDNKQDEIPNDDQFFTLFDGTIENSGATTYRLNFDEQEVRFFKLVVRRNSGQTVIRELNAGRAVGLSQTVKPKNFEKSQDGFVENSANGKLSAQTDGAFYEFEFLGSGFDVFADTDPNYGTAKVFLDEVEVGDINLAEKSAFNKCVFRKADLEVKNHVVKIVSNSSKKFNISFINVTYGTPVDEEDYPTLNDEFGDRSPLVFPTEWRTFVQDYKNLSRIDFVTEAPQGYDDTFVRLNTYIRVYRDKTDKSRVAFVYPGKIVAPFDSSSLFAGCASLQAINFENFDTSSMLFATSMFNGCREIEQLDLSSFNTEKTLFLGTVFENCNNLKTLNISSFSVNSKATAANMFKGCDKLFTLHVPDVFETTIELPCVFLDNETQKFSHEISPENAGHTLTMHTHEFHHVEYVPASRNKSGIKEHDECICGNVLVDGEEVSAQSIILPPKGYVDIIVPFAVCGVAAIVGAATFSTIRRRKKKKLLQTGRREK